MIPITPIPRHKGEKNLVSNFPKSVCLIRLKSPTYLNSPIERSMKIAGIIHPPYFKIHSGRL